MLLQHYNHPHKKRFMILGVLKQKLNHHQKHNHLNFKKNKFKILKIKMYIIQTENNHLKDKILLLYRREKQHIIHIKKKLDKKSKQFSLKHKNHHQDQ